VLFSLAEASPATPSSLASHIHQAPLASEHNSGLQITVIDHGTVSPTNCVRQLFGAADVA
jgi:hypothetical protein